METKIRIIAVGEEKYTFFEYFGKRYWYDRKAKIFEMFVDSKPCIVPVTDEILLKSLQIEMDKLNQQESGIKT